jgi:RNA polymerase sigma-70 factor, ECF subfamily
MLVSVSSAVAGDRGRQLLSLYDRAVGDVYGYLLTRCRNREVAEEVTAEVFMAAVEAVQRDAVGDLSTAWLIGIARHKLVDHWRRAERDSRRIHAVADDPTVPGAGGDDPWDRQLDVLAARDTLDQLGAHHRAALTLRYLDGLPVAEVADVLSRTVEATEALLTRARRAFRAIYEEEAR